MNYECELMDGGKI